MKANDELRQYSCIDNYYRHPFGVLFTYGIKALCDKFECYWLLDIICSYYAELRNEDFQVWTLSVNEDATAIITATDGNGRELKTQNIMFTDFRAKCAEIWVEGNVVLIPSEH